MFLKLSIVETHSLIILWFRNSRFGNSRFDTNLINILFFPWNSNKQIAFALPRAPSLKVFTVPFLTDRDREKRSKKFDSTITNLSALTTEL